jgi:hypothetical protein
MFSKIREFFVARSYVAKHGNRFLTVYLDGKWHNGQVASIGMFSVTIRKARPDSNRFVKVKHTNVVRVHRDKMRLKVRQEKLALWV